MLYDCFRNFCFNFLPHLLTTLANDKFGPVQVNMSILGITKDL